MEGFNLYREAKSDYDKLIPNKKLGLILLAIYGKFGEEEFKEDDIIRIIDDVFRDMGNSSLRSEYERNNSIILGFQDYFLWREPIRRTYRLKPYGLQFCKDIQQRLETSYNPAKIKRWFDELLNTLQELLLRDPTGGFSCWIEDHFKVRKQYLSQQIESLDEQVDRSVKQFKDGIKSNKATREIRNLLSKIEVNLDEIKDQAEEMTKAFQATFNIDELLTGLRQKSLEEEFVIADEQYIVEIRLFNKQVRSSLEQISNRIEKIKPRIRDFFADFNRQDFDRKTVLFLELLLTHSKLENTDKNRKVLYPPNRVNLFRINSAKIDPQFIVFPDRNIETKQPVEAIIKPIDSDRQKEFVSKAKGSYREKQIIEYWVDMAIKKIDEERQLEFSSFFFHVLKHEHYKIHIVVKITQQVLRICRSRTDLLIEIEQTPVSDKEIENIAIWKISIQQK